MQGGPIFRARLFALRIDSMLTLFGVALAATLALAWLSGSLEAERAEIGNRSGIAAELDRLGWHPVPTRRARAFEQQSGVSLLYGTRSFELELAPYPLSCNAANVPDALAALEVVGDELGRYERSFLGAVGLERVLFCRDLEEGNKSFPSMPNVQHTLILDTGSSPHFLRRLVHHEIFHFADFADDGSLKQDPAYASLNEKYFLYGFGGRLERHEGSARWSEERLGFVSEYATSALEEDKAELYSFAMMDPERVSKRALRDPVLAKKLAYLDEQLSDFPGAPRLAVRVGSN